MALPRTYADLRTRLLDRGTWATIHSRAAARSRVTNLGVGLLIAALTISLLFNLRGSGAPAAAPSSPLHTETHEAAELPREDVPALPSGVVPLRHLVVVAGHGIWNGQDITAAYSEKDWLIESYQRNSVKTFVKHIEKGLEVATADPSSVLVFSGGETRRESLLTEAGSYMRLALGLGRPLPHYKGEAGQPASAFQPFDGPSSPAAPAAATGDGLDLMQLRMTTEDYARDSFENLLFSIARFREFTGNYPERITVVGYKYKEARFVNLHARAVRWPQNRLVGGSKPPFTYIGIDDEIPVPETERIEHEIKYKQFAADMYGCNGKLVSLRRRRNPTRRVPPYASSAPEIAALINWCPPPNLQLQGLFPGWLPWDPRVQGNGLGEGARSVLEANGGYFIRKEVLPDGKRIVY